MTSNDDPLPKGGQLRDEAADWFAQMRGPDAETHRTEFEAWLARGALHRSAYNRVAETFALGKRLKGQDFEAAAAAEPDLGVHPRKPRRAALLVCLAAVGLSVGSILFLQNPTTRGGDQVVPVASVPKASGSAGTIELTARPNSSGTFALSDGSKVRLASDSSVAVSYTSAERGLRLTRGQALFTVAHEGRPFVVRVANGSVTARGTIFEVALTRQQGVRVKLLRGVVDVDVPAAIGRPPSEHEIRSLKPGEEIRFASQIPPTSSGVQARSGEYRPQGIQEFDQASVADLIAEANRNTAVPIILTSSDIGSQRVSGTFRLENTAKLSQNLADLLGLAITINPGNIMLSRGCRATSQEKCRPPS